MNRKIFLHIGILGSIIGCAAVSIGDALFANLFWLLTNPCMLIYNIKIKEKAQAMLWGIYILLAILGIFHNWR